ncbi:MAG: hypothetical protein PUE36_06155 [Bacteroidales bacterium]|nr:hypothetical protein [Bacteroidales bacterium]
MDIIGNISIEKFAAFLDGNLPEDELLSIETAIDGNAEYADILREVMEVDDAVDMMLPQADAQAASLPDIDIVLPEIPLPADGGDEEVELAIAHPSACPSVVAVAADSQAMPVAPDDDAHDTTPASCAPEATDELGEMDDSAAIDDSGWMAF